VTSVGNLPIDTPSGARGRLKDVATISLRPNPNAIDRQGDSRRLDVGANVENADLGKVVGELQARLGRYGARVDRRTLLSRVSTRVWRGRGTSLLKGRWFG
jgi:multidrug efflux pump subunit AcrB